MPGPIITQSYSLHPSMGNLKPFQVIVMGIFGFVALAGVLLFSTFQGFSSGAAQVGTVTIWGTIPASGMTSALAEFKNTRPEYAAVTYVARPADTFDNDLAEAIASGRGPDLILINQEDLIAAQSKLSVIPSSTLSERDFRDSYLPINELYLVSGGTYGICLLYTSPSPRD